MFSEQEYRQYTDEIFKMIPGLSKEDFEEGIKGNDLMASEWENPAEFIAKHFTEEQQKGYNVALISLHLGALSRILTEFLAPRFKGDSVHDVAALICLLLRLPEGIYEQVLDAEELSGIQVDSTGKSGAQVLLFTDLVLKISADPAAFDKEVEMLEWLKGKLPVPEVVAIKKQEGSVFFLMTRIKGKPACDEEYMRQPELQSKLLVDAIKMIWDVNLKDCPSDQRLENKLADRAKDVKEGKIDLENVEPDTFGENGFRDPEELLHWLYDNQPEEIPAFSHGDFCLPNIIFDGDKVSGFIDLSTAGMADPWCDIALCLRSLQHNYDGHYGKKYPGYDPKLFFKYLGAPPDLKKIKYYLLLDELA